VRQELQFPSIYQLVCETRARPGVPCQHAAKPLAGCAAISPKPKPREASPDLAAIARDALRDWKVARQRVLERGARRGDVHDWRIATRRLLAAERLIAPYPAATRGRATLESELQRAFRAAGRVRDAHIGIALAREFAPALPVAGHVAATLRGRLPRRRRKLRRRLEQVRITRLRRVMQAWSLASGDALARRATGRLAGAQRRLERALATVPPRGDASALHRLRIEVKHARYMADGLATYGAGAGRAPAVRRLADWQRELGAIADLAAFDAEVERYARSEPTRAADAVRLRRALAQRQRRLARSFLRRQRRSA